MINSSNGIKSLNSSGGSTLQWGEVCCACCDKCGSIMLITVQDTRCCEWSMAASTRMYTQRASRSGTFVPVMRYWAPSMARWPRWLESHSTTVILRIHIITMVFWQPCMSTASSSTFSVLLSKPGSHRSSVVPARCIYGIVEFTGTEAALLWSRFTVVFLLLNDSWSSLNRDLRPCHCVSYVTFQAAWYPVIWWLCCSVVLIWF